MNARARARALSRPSTSEDPDRLTIVLGPYEVKGGQEISFQTRLMRQFHLEYIEITESKSAGAFFVKKVTLSNPPLEDEERALDGIDDNAANALNISGKDRVLYESGDAISGAASSQVIHLEMDAEAFDLLTTIVSNKSGEDKPIKVIIRGRKR